MTVAQSEPVTLADPLGRTPIADHLKQQVKDAFALIPTEKRSALLVIHDFDTQTTRFHVAARIGKGDTLKVAAGPGFDWAGKKPIGWVAVSGSW